MRPSIYNKPNLPFQGGVGPVQPAPNPLEVLSTLFGALNGANPQAAEPNAMLGIPGMGGGGGRGGFMARGAGQQGGMSPVTQTVLGKEAEKRRQQAMKLQEKARMMEQEANELEMPKMQRPVNDTEAGIGSILMLLAGALGGGEGAAEFADGFMRSRQQGAARTDEENMRRYQQQQRSMQIGAGNEMERAKMELGEAERIEGRVDNERDRMYKIQDDEAKRKEAGVTVAQARYYSANTPAEKQAAAAQLQRLGVPIDEATVASDVNQMRAIQSQSARSQWDRVLNQYRDDYGEVPEGAVSQLEAQRRELAAAYGVPESLFGMIPTGRTLASQKFEQAKSQFEQTFQLREKQFNETLAKHQRDYELAKQRIAIMSRNASTSAGNLTQRKAEAEYRKALDAAEKKFDVTAKEIAKIEKEINVQKRVIDAFKPNWSTKADTITKEREKLDRLNAEYEALKQMRDQAELEAQEMDEVLGAGNKPGAQQEIQQTTQAAVLQGQINNRGRGTSPTKTPPKPQPKAKTMPKGWSVEEE